MYAMDSTSSRRDGAVDKQSSVYFWFDRIRTKRVLTVTQVDVSAGEMQGASETGIQLFREWLPGLGVYPRPGEPKIDEIKFAAFLSRSEDEVARLDVAVNDTLVVDMLNDVQLAW